MNTPEENVQTSALSSANVLEPTMTNIQPPRLPNQSLNGASTSTAPVQAIPERRESFDEEDKRFQLKIRQQPKQARCSGISDRVDRRPVDPLPILQLIVEDVSTSGRTKNFISNPFYFAYATLIHSTTDEEINILKDSNSRAMTGSIASSLQRLKDIDGSYGGFFVFPDISIRVEGKFRLRFTLFEIIDSEVVRRNSVNSDVFTVYSPKTFPGMSESTPLSRFFAEQGLKIRLRKETRLGNRRRQQNKTNADEDSEEDEDTGKDRKRRKSVAVDEKARINASNRNKIEENEGGRFISNVGHNGMVYGNGHWSGPPIQAYPPQHATPPPVFPRPPYSNYYDPNINRTPRHIQTVPDHHSYSLPGYPHPQQHLQSGYPSQHAYPQPGYPQYPNYSYQTYSNPYAQSPLVGGRHDGGYIPNNGEYFNSPSGGFPGPNSVEPQSVIPPYIRDHPQQLNELQQGLPPPSSTYSNPYGGQSHTGPTSLSVNGFSNGVPSHRHSISTTYMTPGHYYPESRSGYESRMLPPTPTQPAQSTQYYNAAPTEIQNQPPQAGGYELRQQFRQDSGQGGYSGPGFQ